MRSSCDVPGRINNDERPPEPREIKQTFDDVEPGTVRVARAHQDAVTRSQNLDKCLTARLLRAHHIGRRSKTTIEHRISPATATSRILTKLGRCKRTANFLVRRANPMTVVRGAAGSSHNLFSCGTLKKIGIGKIGVNRRIVVQHDIA